MRLFQFLCKARVPQDIKKVPLRAPRLPFKLRNCVSGRQQGIIRAESTQEVINVMSAMAKHDFNEQYCQNEIAKLKKAADADYKAYLAREKERKSGKIVPGKNLKPMQLNKILKKYPV